MTIFYRMYGVEFRQHFWNTRAERAFAWSRCEWLIANGVPVRVTQR
jgi:hypothetical protein